jgi:tRNA G37 N-methylase TrmD
MTIVAAILCAAPLVPRSGSAQATKEPLKGSLEKGVYTSPNKDYQIRVPSDIRSGNGGQIRDEVSVPEADRLARYLHE